MNFDWVVYPKPCVNHTERVVEYLARYSHRTAISDPRITGVDKSQALRDETEALCGVSIWFV